jgi:hypothetical protein
MFRLKNLPLILILIFFFAGNNYSQQNFSMPDIEILKLDFAPVLDSLIKPPANCAEARGLVWFDTLKRDFILDSALQKQDNRIKKLYTDITINLDKTKQDNSQMPQTPSGGGPSRGSFPTGRQGPPGGMDNPGSFQEIREDMEDINEASDKINVLQEKFKNELNSMQGEVNENLHKTRENDYDAHINIMNDFMKSALDKYNLYGHTFKENMKRIDEVIKKYDYGEKVKFGPVKREFLELQLQQINTLKFLFNITKEFALLGAKFYYEKQMSME